MIAVRTFSMVAVFAVLLVGAPSQTAPQADEAGKPAAVVSQAAAAASSDDTADTGVSADEERAKEVLAELQQKYRLLDGAFVHMGPTPKGEQAVSYYMDGEIVVSPEHDATIDEILAHEIWHVIDWRDNGRLDWGEDLPPINSSDYLK
jgi:hypothetical protein